MRPSKMRLRWNAFVDFAWQIYDLLLPIAALFVLVLVIVAMIALARSQQ